MLLVLHTCGNVEEFARLKEFLHESVLGAIIILLARLSRCVVCLRFNIYEASHASLCLLCWVHLRLKLWAQNFVLLLNDGLGNFRLSKLTCRHFLDSGPVD